MKTATTIKAPYTINPPKTIEKLKGGLGKHDKIAIIDQLGELNEWLAILGEERQKLIDTIKKGTSLTVYGRKYIGQLTVQERTALNRKLIPEKILKAAMTFSTVRVLTVKKRTALQK